MKMGVTLPVLKNEIIDFFSHGWAQAVITTRRYFLGNVQSEERSVNY